MAVGWLKVFFTAVLGLVMQVLKIWCCVTNPDESCEEDKTDIFFIRGISHKNKTITKDIVT